jgi:hypothetical protein
MVGLVLVIAGVGFAVVKLAPCAFADSRDTTEGILASVERWVEIEEPVPDVPGMLPDGNGNAMVELKVRYLSPDGDSDSAIVSEGISIHDVFLREIRPALDEGSRVFLALTSQGLIREMVAYGIERRTDGTHVFLPSCHIDLTAEARGLLGPRYDAAMRRIIGLTDPGSIYGVLAGVRKAPDRVLVEYEERPDVRLFSRTGRLIERGACLAVVTDVGPLVPIWEENRYYLALDDHGLVLMSGLDKAVRPGDALEVGGREMSPEEALSVIERPCGAAPGG